MQLAIVCSAHGLGHVTRQLAIARALRQLQVDPVLFSAAPAALVEAWLPGARHRPWTADVGIAQVDSITEDLDQTLRLLDQRCGPTAIARLADALSGFDGVIADAPPTALEAARIAGVPAVAIGNFDWAWIYRQYSQLRDWSQRFAAWQAPHPAVSLAPGPGMSGFQTVTPFGPVGRRAPAAPGLPPGAVLVSFGGFGLRGLDAVLPRIPGVTWVTAAPTPALDRRDCLQVSGVPYPSLVAGVDAVLTKPGYGIIVECMLAGTPIAWIQRGAFPEAPHLEKVLTARGDQPVDPRATSVRDAVATAVGRVLGRPRPDPVHAGEAGSVATWLVAAFAAAR